MPKIYCGVTNCQYNGHGLCNIDNIEVNTNAKNPQLTEVVNCMTFKPKSL